MGGNFKIRVVENIGAESESTFGVPGTILYVVNGTLRDFEGYIWESNFQNLDEIHKFFNHSAIDDCFATKFELVEEE
ncbi:hypothetical protein [Anaerocolumna chitinilytica]|uniref:Uncharacterized protein n=1 Tax=Anaerocolumna chitinilytica TaxID=1727145 RepID=A0A7M3SAM2_9FIRM|nr:hypothetical protein [Anaerocolumna chitinilytica]BCK01640.1 hypothetical protein bsdcttw_46800 [Anaerocolumna chitinilytica]